MKIDAETYQKLPEHLKSLFQQAPNPTRDEVVAAFPVTGPASDKPRHNKEFKSVAKGRDLPHTTHGHNDNGGSAARFFYCAKASRRDRDEGLEGMPDVDGGHYRQDEWSRKNMGSTPDAERKPVKNNHPTVKPSDLMRYLCRLVTPKGGIVLDPFMGSGSTGKAAIREGFGFIGIERDTDSYAIAKARITHETL